MIILEVELMDCEDPLFKDTVRRHKAVRIRKFWAPRNATPGDGEICLYTLPNLSCAVAFMRETFGNSGTFGTQPDCVGEWTIRQVTDGYYCFNFV
jgi:hypothetical protein